MRNKLSNAFPKAYYKTMQEASYDSDKKIYMVDYKTLVLKLDDYNQKCYQKALGCRMCLRGGDACLEKNNEIFVFEFKNCYPAKKKIFEILEKMYCSSIVLMDKLDMKLTDFKKNVHFILVYTLKDECDEKNMYCSLYETSGYNKIRFATASRSTCKIKEIDKSALGLKKLEKYLYKHVSAIPIEYFQKFLKEESIL